MKTRQSGMPQEELWASFFSPQETLARLGLTGRCRDVVDFGCGYGTFTIPAARMVRGSVHALDIEPEMIAATMPKARAGGLDNVRVERRDFVADGTGLPNGGVDYAMEFNILHCEQPVALLREAWRVLRPGGRLGVMHWNYDPATPRGPSMDIRPTPAQCQAWAEEAGFRPAGPQRIVLPPYHWGLVLSRPQGETKTGQVT